MYQALFGGAGAVMGAYGSHKQNRALKSAGRDYDQSLQAYYADRGQASRDNQRQYEGVNDARLNGIGSTLQEYMRQPLGQQPEDTQLIDQSLAQVGSGMDPGAGGSGAAQGWGNRVAQRTAGSVGRQRAVAGDASMLQRIGSGQNRALSDSGLQDQRFGRQVQGIRSREALQNAEFEQALQQLNIQGQARLRSASNVGKDWITVGGMMGGGGAALDAFGGGGGGSSLTQQELGYNPDTDDRGSRVLGYSFNK